MSLPKGSCTALGDANVREVAVILQRGDRSYGLLDRDIVCHTGHLEEVHLLDPAELRVDGLDAASQVLGSARRCDVNTSFTERIAKEIHSRAVRFEAISFEAALM